MPLISVLGAWSLVVIRRRALVGFVLLVLIANAVITHAYAHGENPLYLIPRNWRFAPDPWSLPVHPGLRDKLLLTAAVQKSCRKESVQQPNFVAIDYPNLNVNSANFYSEKQRPVTGLRCHYVNYYVNYGTFQTDVLQALNGIDRVRPAYILTVDPTQQVPADAFNVVTLSVAERLAHDPRYELASDPGDYILIFRRTRQEK
jgi:hypothetical protein